MSRCWKFGAWSFHAQSHVLETGSFSATLEPRVGRLLLFFLEHNGEVLSHDALVAGVWDGRAISDDAVRRAVCELRHVLARDGSDHYLKTLRKRGYLAQFPLPRESPATRPPALWRLLVPGVSAVILLVALLVLQPVWLRAWQQAPDVGTAHPAEGQAQQEYLRARDLVGSYVHADLEQAMLHLRNAIALDPGLAPAYTLLAKTLLIRANDNDSEDFAAVIAAARPLVERALALDPGQSEAWMVRAALLGDVDREQAEADLRHAMRLDPGASEPYERLAGLYFQDPDGEAEALALIDRAIALEPTRARNHHMKAYIKLRDCDLAAAESLSRQALRVEPTFRASLVLLGRIAAMRGQVAEAAGLHEQALALDQQSDWVRQTLHQSYLNIDDLQAAQRLEFGDSSAARWRELLYLGDARGAAEVLYAMQPHERRHLRDWELVESLYWAVRQGSDAGQARRFVSELRGLDGVLPVQPPRHQLPLLMATVRLWHGPRLSPEWEERLRDLYQILLQAHRKEPRCLPGGETVALLLTALALGDEGQVRDLLQGGRRAEQFPADWHWLLNRHPDVLDWLARRQP